jgi:Regulator of chromosome condensation (RCC1) repeat
VSSTGVVSGISVGTAIILATVEGVQGGVQVTVIRPVPLVLGSPRAGSYVTCFLRSNSTTWCWGDGRDGQTGNGVTATEQPTPSLVIGGAGFTQLETGFTHSCALNGSGQAFCWGTNTNGQLGTNSTTPSLVPAAVSGPTTFAQIAAGQFHSCALTAAGAAWCWGTSGATGDANGVGSTRLTPVQVALADSPIRARSHLPARSGVGDTARPARRDKAAHCQPAIVKQNRSREESYSPISRVRQITIAA